MQRFLLPLAAVTNMAKSLVFLLFAAASMCPAQARQPPSTVTIGTKTPLFSTVLNEERELLIALPQGYEDSTRRYPVLYLVDGDWDFHFVTGVVEHLVRARRMPPTIVVGIVNTDRIRDFTPVHSLIDIFGDVDSSGLATTGGAARFLKFLQQELAPYIEQHYRTTHDRILAGHSLGGVFLTYLLESAPGFSDSYIIISPAFYGGNTSVVDTLARFLRSHPTLKKTVYLAIGSEPLLDKEFDSVVRTMRTSASPSLRWKLRRYPDDEHASVPLPAMYDGLQFVFSGWSTETPDAASAPKRATNSPLDWLLGEWEGMRRDGADGTESRLITTIMPILNGKGQQEELEVTEEKSVYRGFSVRMPADDSTWVNLYMNSVRPGFVQLDGRIEGNTVTWTPHKTNPSRLSHSIVEPVGKDGFRRIMYVSEDGGKSWKVLWKDEAHRR